MQWAEAVRKQIDALKPIKVDTALQHRMLGLIDLTSLNETDTEANIAALCKKAQTPLGHVAAVCVGRPFVRQVAEVFAGSPVKTATVANFPKGDGSLETVLIEIGQAIQDGAQEVDVVFPYERYLAGERQYAHSFVAACKAACGNAVTLKVILETGVLSDLAIIADASLDVLTSGADFIKTSTGKIPEGATLEAAATMLLVVEHLNAHIKRPMGLKVAGGIRSMEQAAQYVELADQMLGKNWISPDTFRIGSSKLVDEILHCI